MLVTKGVNTAVLHMPKCAGSAIRRSIYNSYPDIRWSCEHMDIRYIPERYSKLRRIGFCRNPLSWYASKYYFGLEASKRGARTLMHVFALSDSFTLSFEQTLPRLLDMNNFIDMNPKYLKAFKRWVAISSIFRHGGRVMVSYPDISEISVSDFGDTLYAHWYNTVGLDTCDRVYKTDDGELGNNLKKEFPKVRLIRANVGTKLNLNSEYSKDMIRMVVTEDEKYFDKYNYSVSDCITA